MPDNGRKRRWNRSPAALEALRQRNDEIWRLWSQERWSYERIGVKYNLHYTTVGRIVRRYQGGNP